MVVGCVGGEVMGEWWWSGWAFDDCDDNANLEVGSFGCADHCPHEALRAHT